MIGLDSEVKVGQRRRLPSLIHEELPKEHEIPLVKVLHRIIRVCVKFLAVLMVLVII